MKPEPCLGQGFAACCGTDRNGSSAMARDIRFVITQKVRLRINIALTMRIAPRRCIGTVLDTLPAANDRYGFPSDLW
ncbi:hypothetical protein [Methylobacterium sp. 10]|uniref:hypothetical protein n=1 Tax=Methylobacterium sp. 10 TaxID=1101191 RepID=UPI001FD9C146|nr:hypothetical protein [Methylobacterium sp. 10]